MIVRYPGLIVLTPPLLPRRPRAQRVGRGLPSFMSALRRVQLRAGVDRRAAGLALARAGVSIEAMRHPVGVTSAELRRRVELAVALARGSSVLIIDEWLHGLEERTARALADTLRQLAAIDTAIYVVGAGLERLFPRRPAGLGPRIARNLLGAATTDSAVLRW